MAAVIEIHSNSWIVSNYYMRNLVARVRLVAPTLGERALWLLDQAAALNLLWLDMLYERDPAEAPQIAAATAVAARSLAAELVNSDDERDRAAARIFDEVAIAAERLSMQS